MTLSRPELSPLESRTPLKDYLIFRVDEAEDHLELADESALKSEAARYADLMDAVELEPGVHYEVRRAADAPLLYSTTDPQDKRKEACWRQTAT